MHDILLMRIVPKPLDQSNESCGARLLVPSKLQTQRSQTDHQTVRKDIFRTISWLIRSVRAMAKANFRYSLFGSEFYFTILPIYLPRSGGLPYLFVSEQFLALFLLWWCRSTSLLRTSCRKPNSLPCQILCRKCP